MATRRSNPDRNPGSGRSGESPGKSEAPPAGANRSRGREATASESTTASTVRPSPAPAAAVTTRAGAAPLLTRRPGVSAEVRRSMIAERAYLRAERRGFAPGLEEEDWLAAEKEIDALLSAGQGARQ